ncbi:hypothetical protein CkaCkLH20_08995 [Colletotrichum karsti]|uniref:Zn(2)-C6 fungal-type domain-containing protein n=1 Tax=Colletotrichum karsti TaxID=1095194 RepID=A0A9P6I251_9PEZI|nr:uncharacterized protein CkaCkLH20_08995 [Colletotrichum karsti]KAF9873536.1 hypothetical protein CkaCkLH20_08995 [Colletotrichum karsti]
MVGVAGRSKGCKTCRRRKKGCDFGQPICENCKRTNNSCEYDRQQVFINVTAPTSSKGSSAKSSLPSTDIVLPQTLARSAYEDKYLSIFWDIWFPCGPTSADCSSKYPISSWTTSARDLYRHDAALRRTLLAMCLSTLGRKENRPSLMADGFQTYVKALREVNVSLRNPKRWSSDAVVVASRGLGLFELLYGVQDESQVEGSQAKSWHGHNVGELALIQQRGPEAYTDGDAHWLFAEGRMHLAIAGCMSRKRCFLSDLRWKTIPWSKIPKTPKDVMLDILTDVPALLQDLDLLQQAMTSNMSRRFLRTYRRLDKEIVWWLENLSPPQKTLDALHERHYENPTADELAVAHVMTYFWTACIFVYSSLHTTLLAPLEILGADAVELSERTDPRRYCMKIADTVEVFFQPEAGTFGMHAAPFPIGIAMKYLMLTEGYTEDFMRFLEYFSRQSDGEAMGRFLVNSLPEWMTKDESIPQIPS